MQDLSIGNSIHANSTDIEDAVRCLHNAYVGGLTTTLRVEDCLFGNDHMVVISDQLEQRLVGLF